VEGRRANLSRRKLVLDPPRGRSRLRPYHDDRDPLYDPGVLPQDIRDRVTSYIQYQATKPRAAIIELVRTSQQRYLDVVSALDDSATSKKPAPEEWSVRELIRHVIQSEQDVAALVQHLSRGALPPEDLTRRRGMGTMLDDDAKPFASFVESLRATNSAMLDAIASLPESPDLETKAPHPFFGPLNCLEWAVFQRVHDEDHIQHAQKILAATS
jgi:hypothetical protein